MAVTISIPYTDEALGHSVIYEEYKGDFAEARRIADARLSEASHGVDQACRAEALFAYGVAQLLQSEIGGALSCFEEVASCAKDPELQARSLHYAYQAMQAGYNLSPGGGAGVPEEWGAQDQITYYLEKQRSQLESLPHLHTPGVILESYMQTATGGIRQGRNDNSPISRQSCREQADGVATLRGGKVMEDAALALLAYLDWQTAALRFASGEREAAQTLLDRARSLYHEASDQAGEACCLMQAGDWLAAPLSSPEICNIWLSAGSKSHSRAWEIESAEATSMTDPEQVRISVDQARANYDKAATLFTAAGASRGTAALALRYSYLATLASRYDHAIEHADRAHRLFTAAGDTRGAQIACAHRILALIGAGRLFEHNREAAMIGAWGRETRSWSYAVGVGILFARIGRRWLIRNGDYERALVCFRLGEELFAALDAPIARSKCIADMVETYSAIGDLAASVVAAEQGLDLCLETLGQRPMHAVEAWHQASYFGADLVNLANQRGDPDVLDRAAARLQSVLNQRPQINLGVLPINLQSVEAVTALKQMEQMKQKSDLETGAWLIQNRLDVARFIAPVYRGQRALKKGDGQEAARWFAIARENMTGNTAFAPAFMEALLAGFERRFADAAQWYRRLFQEPSPKAALLQNLIHGGRDGVKRLVHTARHVFEDIADRLAPEKVGTSPAQMQRAVGNPFLDAQASTNAALQRQQQRGNLELALAFFARSRAYVDAQVALRQLKEMEGTDWWTDANPPWDLLALNGIVCEGLGQLSEALDAFDQAIKVFEAQRGKLSAAELKSALASGSVTQELFLFTARTALKLREQALAVGNADEALDAFERAFAAVERGKARSLLDLMAGGALIGMTPSTESQPLYDWRRANAYLTTRRGLLAMERAAQAPDPRRIAALTAEFAAAEQELNRAEAALVAADPRIKSAQQLDAEPLPSAEVAAALSPGTALLQYAFFDEDLMAWAISNAGVILVHRTNVPYGALPRAISAFRRYCEDGQLVDQSGDELSRLLLEPFASVLHDYRRIIVVPYGPAHLLPFHALPWERKPLAESHALTYLPSASALRYLETPVPRERCVLAVGNPAAMAWMPPGARQRQTLNPLSGAEVEAAYIATLFPGSSALLADTATAGAVRAAIANYPLLHFATHAVLSAETPMLSAVMLANGEALSVYELMGMRLDADLVVLSACRTAEGETTGGDEVLGLTRGLLAAGARAAVVSLWPVNDLATSLLMGHFYQRLRAGDVPATALQAAQKYLRGLTPDQIRAELGQLSVALHTAGVRDAVVVVVDEECALRDTRRPNLKARPTDYSHPCYWAPFVLVGST